MLELLHLVDLARERMIAGSPFDDVCAANQELRGLAELLGQDGCSVVYRAFNTRSSVPILPPCLCLSIIP